MEGGVVQQEGLSLNLHPQKGGAVPNEWVGRVQPVRFFDEFDQARDVAGTKRLSKRDGVPEIFSPG